MHVMKCDSSFRKIGVKFSPYVIYTKLIKYNLWWCWAFAKVLKQNPNPESPTKLLFPTSKSHNPSPY